jgi:SnoaL-like domain
MRVDRMFALAQALAVAKSRQDVPAAVEVLHPEMVLETPAFGSLARGHAGNERALIRFFATFPDYDVDLEGHASDGETLVCWGTVRMTMTGDRFDLASLCAQSGVSTDAVQRALLGTVSR